ncbi:MAG: hypothetical protein OEV44_07370, partial [Spirochaetota bacterium]|nr:hypothetical protein [Spirochaetota bacterium]
MGLFDKMMNLIYEDDNVTTQPVKTQPSAVKQQVASPNIKTQPNQNKINDEVYKQFNTSIQKAMDAENLPGFDLYEFHQIFKQAVSSGEDIKSAFKKALSSSETMRINIDSLVGNYDHYKRIIDNQKFSFENDLEVFYNDNIKNPKSSQELIDRELNEKLEQLKKLETEIQALK